MEWLNAMCTDSGSKRGQQSSCTGGNHTGRTVHIRWYAVIAISCCFKVTMNKFAWEDQSEKQCFVFHIEL